MKRTGECLAVLHGGHPVYTGAHRPHTFFYGDGDVYTGHCGGRTNDVRSATMVIDDVLIWSFLQNYHLDKSNACVHCAPVRFSPLTFRLYEALAKVWHEGEDITAEMAEVREHAGKYAEDKGDERTVHLAWLMWCFSEGYKTAEDRAIMENWFGEHQDNAEDEATRQSLLAMADEVLAIMATEVTT